MTPVSFQHLIRPDTESVYTELLNLYRTLYQEKLMPQQPKVPYPDAARRTP